jgi:tRNA (uracil-5-)-methyltransferase TRM9
VSKPSKGKQKADETLELTNSNSALGPIITIGLDYSTNLIQIAKERSHEVLVGDAIDMPWREGTFDFAISIATIHHFTTSSRRRQAVRTMLRALNKNHGKLFIQVWAVEQERPIVNSQSSTHTEGTEGTDKKPLLKRARDMDKLEKATSALQSLHLSETEKQEVFVPWKLQQRPSSKKIQNDTPDTQVQEEKSAPVFQRYYHLFKAGELRELVMQAAEEEMDEGLLPELRVDEDELWEQGNWCIQARFGA